MSRVLPEEILVGTLYLGMFERAFAMKKDMLSCFADDPPYPPLYGSPYSIYRFRIDTRDNRFGAFDFVDNPAVLGAAIRSGNLGLVCMYDGGLHRQFRSDYYQYLQDEALHPMQFNEVIARLFYDQTVMDQRASRVTYYWNGTLNAIIAQNHTPRFYDPYLQENHDPERYAHFLGRYTFIDPSKILSRDGRALTMLKDHDGTFLRYPVTDEEVEAARRDPNKVVSAVDPAWREKPPFD